MRAWLACFLVCMALAACASTARITGDFGDYQRYRRARLATTLEERLGASDRYLRELPRGDYREDVRAWFVPAEQRYFKLSWDNLPRLRAYLDVMPKGPHAADVADRISQMESRRIYAERREQRTLDKARAFEAALALAADQRRSLLQEFSTLTRLLAATREFGRPLSALDSELSSRFHAEPGVGTCDGDLCSKSFSLPYAVPEDKQLSNRTLELKLEIASKWGQLRGLSLSAPDLFTRVGEAALVRAVPAGNPEARSDALARTLAVVTDAIAETLPEARCRAPVSGSVLLARRCKGVNLEVVASSEASAVDRISIAAIMH